MKIQKDSKDQIYTEIENVRITYVPATGRGGDKDWAGSDVIRIQAKEGPNSNRLYPGAEFPASSPEDFADFVAAICTVYADGRRAAP
jgi:hypothetical protein